MKVNNVNEVCDKVVRGEPVEIVIVQDKDATIIDLRNDLRGDGCEVNCTTLLRRDGMYECTLSIVSVDKAKRKPISDKLRRVVSNFQ